jgi:hypothetical protein
MTAKREPARRPPTSKGSVSTGLALLMAALLLNLVEKQAQDWAQDACSKAAGSLPCLLLDIGIIRLGLGGVSLAVLTAALFHLIFKEWLTATLRRLFEEVVHQATNIREVAVQQARAGRLNRADLRDLFCESLAHAAGHFERRGRDFAGFIFDQVATRPFPTWRSDYTTSISIEEPEPSLPGRDRIFIWRENRSFVVHAPEGVPAQYTVKAGTDIEIRQWSDVEMLFDGFSFKLEFDSTIIAFETARSGFDVALLGNGQPQTCLGFTVQVTATALQISFVQTIDLIQPETRIRTVERSFILRSDLEYVKFFNEPTKTFSLNFLTPPNYTVVHCDVGEFTWGAGQRRDNQVGYEGRDAWASSTEWALPGIVVAVVWRPLGVYPV